MQKLEHLINHHNASLAVRYLLNLDIHDIDEKYRKIGITNLIDFAQAKKLCRLIRDHHSIPSEESEQITKQAISLSRVLNNEAKENLFDYLTLSQQP